MKEITVKEMVERIRNEVVDVESMDGYGISVNMSKARIEYDKDMNELSFVAGNYNTPDGIGSISICIDDVVDYIRLEDDGSYTIEFNQYIADIKIKESNI